MKKLLLISSIMLTIIFSTAANNNPVSSVFTLSTNEKSFVIDLETFKGGEVEYVTLENNDGEIIFMDYIEPNKQRIKYVLDYLPTETFTVKIKGDELIEYYMINVTEDLVKLVDVKTYSSPSITTQPDKIIIENENDGLENVSLTIFSNNEIIYSYAANLEGTYQKAFNLNQLANGNYKILVSNDRFTKEVFITR